MGMSLLISVSPKFHKYLLEGDTTGLTLAEVKAASGFDAFVRDDSPDGGWKEVIPEEFTYGPDPVTGNYESLKRILFSD